MDEQSEIRRAENERKQAEYRERALKAIEENPGEYIATCIEVKARKIAEQIPERMRRLGTKTLSIPWVWYSDVDDILNLRWKELPPETQKRIWGIVADIADHVRSEIGDWLNDLRKELDHLLANGEPSGSFGKQKYFFEFWDQVLENLGVRPQGHPPKNIENSSYKKRWENYFKYWGDTEPPPTKQAGRTRKNLKAADDAESAKDLGGVDHA